MAWMIISVLGFILLSDNHSYFVIPEVVLLFTGAFLILRWIDTSKCPKCNCKSLATGIGGTKFHQYYCKSCQDTFWKPN